MNFLSKIPSLAEGKRFYIILGAIFAVGLIARVLYLPADAPIGLTRSQDVSTDPFAYTYFAKNLIERGNANPFNDPRWIVYEKSTQTVAALIVYAILGTGRAQGNLTAVILNLLAIFFIVLAIKNYGSRLAALFFALLACMNFTLIMFARIPFLEASQNLWLAAAFYFFSLGEKRKVWFFAAGAATAAAAFFGKMVALYAGGLYLAVWVFKLLTAEDNKKSIFADAVKFYVAYVAVGMFWFLYTYLPSASEVSSYYAEQGLGLYGSPKAFEELRMFFWQIQNLLAEREFFAKLPFVTLLSAFGGAMAIAALVRSLRERKVIYPLSSGWVILVVWLLVAYVALFPFNYRPLRYQTTLMFPMMALAGILLAMPFEYVKSRTKAEKKKKSDSEGGILTAIFWGLWFAPFLCAAYLVLRSSSFGGRLDPSVLDSIYVYTILFIGIGFAFWFVVKLKIWQGAIYRDIAQFGVLLVVAALLITQTINYVSWAGKREYSLLYADRDIGAILSKDAVLSGSYATALTQENGLGCIHHQFGVETPDLQFFDKFPITHLAVDEGNEKRAREDYPGLMSHAIEIGNYRLRGLPVKLYDISQASPNATAQKYQPSLYEKAKFMVARNQPDSAAEFMDEFLDTGAKSYTAQIFVAENLMKKQQYEPALNHLQDAVSIAPFDLYLSYIIAQAFLNAAQSEDSPVYLKDALKYLEFAAARVPRDQRLQQAIETVKQQIR